MGTFLETQIVDRIINDGSLFFTSHQINIIKKKREGLKLKQSEKVEYSRSIVKKLKELESFLRINKKEFYFNSEKDIMRKTESEQIMKKLSRKFRNKKILISGSFLYKNKYNDVDVFIILKYDKEDFFDSSLLPNKKIHINYINEKDLGTLFFRSVALLSVSNFDVSSILENDYNIKIDEYISMFLELLNDIKENPKSAKKMLRSFIIESEYISTKNLLNSKQLSLFVETLNSKKDISKIIENIFRKTMFSVKSDKKIVDILRTQEVFQKRLANSFKQHSEYYLWISNLFKEVLDIGFRKV